MRWPASRSEAVVLVVTVLLSILLGLLGVALFATAVH